MRASRLEHILALLFSAARRFLAFGPEPAGRRLRHGKGELAVTRAWRRHVLRVAEVLAHPSLSCAATDGTRCLGNSAVVAWGAPARGQPAVGTGNFNAGGCRARAVRARRGSQARVAGRGVRGAPSRCWLQARAFKLAATTASESAPAPDAAWVPIQGKKRGASKSEDVGI